LTDRLTAFEGWVHGYLTAHNRLDQGTFDAVSWQGNNLLMGALEAYCKQNADQRFEIAVAGLINTLRPDRITEQSDMVQIKSGDRTILVYREVVVRLQKALVQRKLYTGKPDGRFGEDTRRAVEAFQKSQNLETTGLPDQRTLLALLPSSTPAASTGSKPPAGGATPQRPTTRPQPSR
jgi:peptidoglycan hydrolase-like protein with peptidoglycan-binding domain